MTQQMPDGFEVFRELTEGLIEVLESWPLYRRFEYTDPDRHFLDAEGETFGVLPQEIVLPCSNCKGDGRWRRTGGGVGGEGRIYLNKEPHNASYTCNGCDRREIYFAFYWYLTPDGGLFQKIGQYPPLHYFHVVSRDLATMLSDAGLKLYRQALSNRNSNFGIGAVAYLRRVVEHVLDGVLEPGPGNVSDADRRRQESGTLEQAGNSNSAEEKIALAAQILSAPLKSGGDDPLDRLDHLFKVGPDSKSDEACIALFDQFMPAFESLVRASNVARDQGPDAVGDHAS